MIPPETRILPVLLCGALCLGASCSDKNNGGEAPGGSGGSDPGPQVEELSQVDVSDLSRGEREIWVDLINDHLSPCGDPVSVGLCVSEGRGCRRCVPAARYLARLVAAGLQKSEIQELYSGRYGDEGKIELSFDHAPVRGAPMAPVTIVEFSDFECSYCGAAHPQLQRVLREFEGKVRFVFMHYPLDSHPRALPAARAAIAAGNQRKFWEMHDLLFENQDSLEDTDLLGYAGRLGLDLDRFKADLASEETQRRVEKDKELGRSVDVQGTPTIIVNGRLFEESSRALGDYIREELDQ